MSGVQVTGPTCVPTRYGLLSVAEIEDRVGGHWEGSEGLEYDLETCEDLFATTACGVNPSGVKDPAGGTVSTEQSGAFALVAGYRCSTGGRPANEAWDHADARLNRGELRALERTFWTGLSVEGNEIPQSLGSNADAVDLTTVPGTPENLTAGLAILEAWAGDVYPCSPIIHANRGLGVLLAERNLTERDGGILISSGTGSRVVIGGGYLATGPLGDEPEDGSSWMYITGSIKVLRGPVFHNPEPGAVAASIDRSINSQIVFSERTYAFVQDCIIGAVLVDNATLC